MQQVCHRCKQKFSSKEMIQVSLSADGEYITGQRNELPGIVAVGRNYLVWYGSVVAATMLRM